MESKAAALQAQSAARIFRSTDLPYLGGTPVIRPGSGGAAGLDEQVSFRSNGTLDMLTQGLASVLPLSFRVDLRSNAPGSESSPTPANPKVNINYSGPLRGLLDQLADTTDSVWDYDPGQGVTFSRYAVKTFTILAAPGITRYGNAITNRTKETSVVSGMAGAGGSGGAGSGSGDQTAQTNSTEFASDVWAEIENAVKNVLSPEGKVTGNPAMGTITVADRASALRQVTRLIDSYNSGLSRQVAYAVHVWSLDINDTGDAGLDVGALLKTGGVSLGSAFPSLPSDVGQLSATILDGKWQGTTTIAQAMLASGKATQISGGSGITMNNQPAPIQNVQTQGYIQSVSSVSSETSDTYTVTPSEITHGFAMTIIPHILDRRRLILQYNISLSALDRMEDYAVGDMRVQIPTVSAKSFSQRVSMRMGQTLVLAGFVQDRESSDRALGLLGFSNRKNRTRTLIVITIDVESFGAPLMEPEPTLIMGDRS